MRRKILTELLLTVRFGLVGILTTAIHITVLWMLLSKSLLPIFIANIVAFSFAFGPSFIGHYFWTFRASGFVRRAMLRFLTISMFAFLLNNIFLSYLLNLAWFSPITTAIASSIVIPIVTFFAIRLWAFDHISTTLPASKRNYLSTKFQAMRLKHLKSKDT